MTMQGCVVSRHEKGHPRRAERKPHIGRSLKKESWRLARDGEHGEDEGRARAKGSNGCEGRM